ncbi:MAG: hypothetical protein CHACPFDD_02659 [Phycisphaerae bacterium]|nr:hypothetical protein [Phycisphaerae bacterium]
MPRSGWGSTILVVAAAAAFSPLAGAWQAATQPAGAVPVEDQRAAWDTWRAFKAHNAACVALKAARDELEAATKSGDKAAIERATRAVAGLSRMGAIGMVRKELKAAQRLVSAHRPTAIVPWPDLFERVVLLANNYDTQERLIAVDELDGNLSMIADHLISLVPPLLVYDAPADAGKAIVYGVPPAAEAGKRVLERQEVSRQGKAVADADWVVIARVEAGPLAGADSTVRTNHVYRYRLRRVADGAEGVTIVESQAVKAAGNWFDPQRQWLLLITALFCIGVWAYIQIAKRGAPMNIRKIAGLEAVDDAVGRATEMGRPIIFIPGIQDMNDIQTVAGLIILGRVAQTAAEHDAQLEVPTSRSLVMTTARETVATSYMNAGRPDAYDEKKIYYVTDEQFGYVAAVTGTMVRQKPATCIYMGSFFAESLILAETGNAIGAIQIAGTAQPAQLPFFVAACDYTLLGEEFFAASAYLSGEPAQLGTLKGQDLGKMFALAILLIGVIVGTGVELLRIKATWLDDVYLFLVNDFLRAGGGA